jgi:hypothetical protein
VVDQQGYVGDAYFGEWSQYNEPLSSHMDSQEMLYGDATASVINRNNHYGSPKASQNNRTFYKKKNHQLTNSLHPTLRRGTDMTKSTVNEIVSTEAQANMSGQYNIDGKNEINTP